MKRFLIFGLLALMALFGFVACNEDPESINNAPEIYVDEATDLLRTSAILTGRILAPAKASITEYGFKVSSTSDFSSADTRVLPMEGGMASFSTQITDLEINGTYFYVAYATNGLDEMTSTLKTFTTPQRSGVLLTDLRMVDEETATFTAKVGDTGGGEIHGVGFCWATDDTPTTYDETVLTTLDGDNTFTASLSGLEAGKTYYVRAFADSDILGDGTTQTISYSRDVLEIRLEEAIKEEPSISVEALSSTTTTITYRVTTTAVEQVRQMVIYEEALEVYGEISPELVFQGDYEIEPNTTVELTVSNLSPATTYYVFVAAKVGEEYLIGEPAIVATQPEEVDPELTKIYYTTTDEQIITSSSNPTGLNIVSNSYENGRGVITYDGVVTQIPSRFMYGEMTLKSIVLPGAVTQIGTGAFESCTALESVTLPESVAKIDQMAFAYTALRELILPESVTEIGNQAFMNCSYLESVTISGSPAVHTDAFSGCSSISSVHINSLEAWCKCDFGGWGYLMYSASNPCSYGATLYLNGVPVTEVTIPQGVTALSDGAFAGCGSLLKVTIPDHVTEIGSRCFNACENLEAVYCLSTTPATPKPEIFPGTYGDQYDWHPFPLILETFKIYVPNASVESYRTTRLWAQYADYIYPMDGEEEVPETWKIYYTSTDEEIIEPNLEGLWSDPREAFGASIVSNTYSYHAEYGGNSYGVIEFDGPVTTVGYMAFRGSSRLTKITLPESLLSIGIEAFLGCNELQNIILPEHVTIVEAGAFQDCSKLETVTTGSELRVAEGVFLGCDKLTAFYGPFASEDGRALIVNEMMVAFAPYELALYTIPEQITVLGSHLFYGCEELTTLTIPSRVTAIRDVALYGCGGLESLFCYPMTPPGGGEQFLYASPGAKIYVPNASIEAYKKDADWSEYADRIYPMDGSGEVTGSGSFGYTGSLVNSYTIGAEAATHVGLGYWYAQSYDPITDQTTILEANLYPQFYEKVTFEVDVDWLTVGYGENETWWYYDVEANTTGYQRTATVTATFYDVEGYVLEAASKTKQITITQDSQTRTAM